MKKLKIKVKYNDNLVHYLTKEGLGKNKIKTLVRLGNIYINNNKITRLPYEVYENDYITIDDENKLKELEIIYEDNNYLIVSKEAGLLTISTSNMKKNYEDTLYKRVRKYVNEKKEKCFIVNRIDKETSGIVIFVKKLNLKNKLQNNWNKIVKERRYIAIVSGIIPNKKGKIDNYLYEDKLTFSHSTTHGGKRAITNYEVLKTNNKYTMLDINIETGRKNQIRVHFSEMNHPILGDKKYLSKDNPLNRLCLHHYKISLKDPITNKIITFESEIPREFSSLFNHN